MKKSCIGIACVVMFVLIAIAPVKAMAETSSTANTTQVQLLQQLLVTLQTMLAQLQQIKTTTTSGSGVIVKTSNTQLQNLTITEISLSLPNGIGHTSMPGYPVPDQLVTVEVKNNQYGSYNLSGKKFEYTAYLYEIDDSGERTRTSQKTTGEALVPYSNGYTAFEFYLDGGLPYNGKDFEKDYQIRVDIDTNKDVKESNERDNRGWSNEWMTDYYKG
jgi:hypothetical protein